MTARILLLGGVTEALAIARRLGPQHVYSLAGIGRVPVSPHLFQERLAGEHLPRLACQRHQEIELERGETQVLAIAKHLMPLEIHGKVSHPKSF